MKPEEIKSRLKAGRNMHEVGGTDLQSKVGDQQVTSLGPLMNLVGKWASVAQGWNLIALPFRDPSAQFKYRLLMNQYGENLDFFFVDENIPNRGIQPMPTT